MQVPRELWPIVYRLATLETWPPKSDVNAQRFFEFANQQYLLPLLMGDADVPTPIAEAKSRYRVFEALYRKRYELNRNATLELIRVLGPESFLFFKGSDLRHRLYARPDLRPMDDVDIYIPRTEVSSAVHKLAAAGYPRVYSRFGFNLEPNFHEIGVRIKGVLIELHHGFVHRLRTSIDYDELWNRRERFDHDGVKGYRLSPADAVLAQAFSIAKDEFTPKLIRYVDFFLLLKMHEDQIPGCVARAKAWAIERPMFGALHLSSNLFPSVCTNAVMKAMDELLNRPTKWFLVDHVLPNPATERSGYVTGRVTQLWRKFWLIDRAWRRIAFFAYHIYATVVGATIEWRGRRNGLLPRRN